MEDWNYGDEDIPKSPGSTQLLKYVKSDFPFVLGKLLFNFSESSYDDEYEIDSNHFYEHHTWLLYKYLSP